MKKFFYFSPVLFVTLLLASGITYAQGPESKMAYIVSMEQPASHYYHVELQYDGISAESVDLKMPAWTPEC